MLENVYEPSAPTLPLPVHDHRVRADVCWGGNRLAYPHWTGFSAHSQTSMSYCVLSSCPVLVSCHVGCTTVHVTMSHVRFAQCHHVGSSAECPFGYTVFAEIQESSI